MNYNNAKQQFEKYLDGYDSNNDKVRLKIIHTYGVVHAMEEICHRMRLSEEDTELARIIALLHDIGRFEQLKQYDTFLDHKSVDHASLSCRVLRENHVLDRLAETDREAVLTAIENHNRLRIDPTVTAAASSCSDDAQSLGAPGP